MSALLVNQVKHIQAQLNALQHAYDDLAERVLALEAEKPNPAVVGLDVDTLSPASQPNSYKFIDQVRAVIGDTPVKRGPGRPRKAA